MSFERLSVLEKKALASFSILPESFDIEVSTAVLGETTFCTNKLLQSLRRKSLLDSSRKQESFTMHNLLQSFVREKGKKEMKESILGSTARFYAFYVSRFEMLNEQFLKGNSMSAFLAFCEDKESFIQSLIESCSDSRTADRVFDVLIKAEHFLDSVFWRENAVTFYEVFDSAIKAATRYRKDMYYRRLIVSKAFGQLTWGAKGITMQLLSEVDKLLTTSSFISSHQRGKFSCYLGLYQLVKGEKKKGIECLQEVLSSMDNSPEQTVLGIIASQILAVYSKFHNHEFKYSQFYRKALDASKKAGDIQLTVIPATVSTTMHTNGDGTLSNQPLQLQVMFHVKEASRLFPDIEIETYKEKILLKMLSQVETAIPSDPALFHFFSSP